ncbi:hypothetical protein D3C71_1125790 [compost metagenome]
MDLDRVVQRARAPLAGGELDQRGFIAHVLAAIAARGCGIGQRAQRFDVHVHVDQAPLDGLALGQRLAEGHALLGPFHRHVQRALHAAQRLGRAQQTVMDGEPALAQAKAVADLAQHVGVGHEDLVEMHQILGRARTQPGADAAFLDVQALGALFDDEHGDAAALAFFGIRHRLHLDDVRAHGVGDPHLGAVDQPAAFGLGGACLHHAAGIGARIGLGLREASGLVAGDHRLEKALDLVARGLVQDVGHGSHGKRHGAVVQLLADDDLGQQAHAGAAVLLGHGHVPQAGVLGDSHQAVDDLLVEDAFEVFHGSAIGGPLAGKILLLQRHQLVAHDAARHIADFLDHGRELEAGSVRIEFGNCVHGSSR